MRAVRDVAPCDPPASELMLSRYDDSWSDALGMARAYVTEMVTSTAALKWRKWGGMSLSLRTFEAGTILQLT